MNESAGSDYEDATNMIPQIAPPQMMWIPIHQAPVLSQPSAIEQSQMVPPMVPPQMVWFPIHQSPNWILFRNLFWLYISHLILINLEPLSSPLGGPVWGIFLQILGEHILISFFVVFDSVFGVPWTPKS